MMSIRIFALASILISSFVASAARFDSSRTLIVFFDGLRPDYITPALMPNLYRFGQTASQGIAHRSIFPTVTRVNATTYSTGTYPSRHGILGNSIHFPRSGSKKVFNTGDIKDLYEADSILGGKLVNSVSLGDILRAAGKEMVVFSSGSSGQAYLQNPSGKSRIFNTDLTIADSVIAKLGPVPPAAKPNTLRHKWVTDALIQFGLQSGGPLVSAIWFSDPDGAAHSDGIGSPAAIQSLKSVDHEFGRILSFLKETGNSEHYNIIISTDHGFVTHIGKESLNSFLVQKGLKKNLISTDIILAGGAIYINAPDTTLKRKIVHALQSSIQYGAIFTNASSNGSLSGEIPGTLAFESINWNFADRVPDILVDMNWNDSINAFGYRGASYSSGVAGHGTLSPYETNIKLLVAGPSFRKGLISNLPTSNMDIAPTVLKLHGLGIPGNMDGRPVDEFFIDNKSKSKARVKKEVVKTSNVVGDTTYTLQLQRSLYKGRVYIDYAEVTRESTRYK